MSNWNWCTWCPRSDGAGVTGALGVTGSDVTGALEDTAELVEDILACVVLPSCAVAIIRHQNQKTTHVINIHQPHHNIFTYVYIIVMHVCIYVYQIMLLVIT